MKYDWLIILIFLFIAGILGFAGWYAYQAVDFVVTVILAQPL
jgi:hypothetical protein